MTRRNNVRSYCGGLFLKIGTFLGTSLQTAIGDDTLHLIRKILSLAELENPITWFWLKGCLSARVACKGRVFKMF